MIASIMVPSSGYRHSVSCLVCALLGGARQESLQPRSQAKAHEVCTLQLINVQVGKGPQETMVDARNPA